MLRVFDPQIIRSVLGRLIAPAFGRVTLSTISSIFTIVFIFVTRNTLGWCTLVPIGMAL